jgi:four helix bundle protein
MENFKKLKVWIKAHKLVLAVYKATHKYPPDEKFGLTSQMRRASISVVANIVEGSKRKTKNDRKHFHVMADTSLEELKYYFVLSYDLRYISMEEGEALTEQAREIGRMLQALTKAL